MEAIQVDPQAVSMIHNAHIIHYDQFTITNIENYMEPLSLNNENKYFYIQSKNDTVIKGVKLPTLPLYSR